MTDLLDSLLSLPKEEIEEAVSLLDINTAYNYLNHGWSLLWARDEQKCPEGDWTIWLFMGGRGSGKTRAGAEWVIEGAKKDPTDICGLIAPTAADVRDTMLEGESGILSISSRDFYPNYEPSKRKLTFPNGAICKSFSADEPERLRGPNHKRIWCDEIRAWRKLGANKLPEAWNNAMFGLRLPPKPKACITTTSKPCKLLKELIERSKVEPDTVRLTTGSTYRNRENLAPVFYKEIVSRYEGTRLGRQEIHAEMLDDIEGALWNHESIEATRVDKHPELTRILVGVDPNVSSGDDADECGIVVVGKGIDGDGYVLGDYSCRQSPAVWAARVAFQYHRYEADKVVAEVNNGGDLVKINLHTVDNKIPVKKVRASHGKGIRAEPVASLSEQGRIHMVGNFDQLEDQMCSITTEDYFGDGSPDRLDAFVWGITELMLTGFDFKRIHGSQV